MTVVRILPEILSNQIAAGEVVQRPVSVVKELVENSIDANATRITIEIERGGKSLIRVSDNGTGLARDDALLSIERYATSKLFAQADLFSISTMGFRGEALPSIASVSKFTMVTRPNGSDIGTRIDITGGKIQNVSDAGAPVGTLVEVKHLFFNTPARKKFLKSDATEAGHVVDVISGMALGHSHIQFRLFLNGKLQKNFSSADDLFQRCVRILGRDVVNKLYPLEFSDAVLRIHGYCSHPLITRSTSSKFFLFVNNRLVYDRGLVSAIFQGYKGRIMKGRFPMGVLFITIAYDQVDVNVHPAKREIKFFNSRPVYLAVSEAVNKALMAAQENAGAYSASDTLPEKVGNAGLNLPRNPGQAPCQKAEQQVIEWDMPVTQDRFSPEKKGLSAGGTTIQENGPSPLGGYSFFKRILGQVLGTYILAESDDGLVLIDQHAAHERILYEQLSKRQASLETVRQDLIVPETLDLNARESDALSKIQEELTSFGFDIVPFGGSTYVIKAIPSIIDEKEAAPLIVDILENKIQGKNDFSKKDWLEQTLVTLSCHSALRANKLMNFPEMKRLLTDLEHCKNALHCPHGRPTMVTLTKDRLEKLFKRVV
ncbi:DNA mismatch repair endonuclease MutL [Desulfobacula sp.]|uniref:DNA mismatch repair endonuclease MutL n=1 Tax=Desulfobacula sp. TaxID=2593537 RepID=UPI00260B1EDF|nr:DNA mismatch repair endonuclease MutL [Desulfobacula sp.]